METSSLRRALVFGRRYVVAVTIAIVAIAVFLTWRADETFESTAYLYVVPSADAAESSMRASSYAQLLQTDPVVERTAARLSVPTEDIRESIKAAVLDQSTIIELNVHNTSGDRAQQTATTVLEEFTRLHEELERDVTTETETATGSDFVVTRTPSLPVNPLASRTPLYLLIALLGGLGLGVLVALWITIRDTSVKGPDDLARSVDAPLLGAIAYDPSVTHEPLLTSLEPQHPRVEAFRVLRTNLQFIDVDRSSRVVVVTSSVPGEGKSSTVANLAIILAQTGMRVAVVEGDLRRPTIGKYLGVPQDLGVTTVLIGRTVLSSALQPAITPGLEVLASGRRPPNPAELIQTRAMDSLIESLRSQFDIVLIDAPPLLPVTDGALLASLADGVVLVVKHGETKHQEVRAAVDRLASVNARLFGVVLNMTPHSSKSAYASGYAYTYEDPQRSRRKSRKASGRRARS